MKKIVKSMLSATLIISISGCGKKSDSDGPTGNANQDAKPVTEMKLE